MVLAAIVGLPGSGKTASLAFIAYLRKEQGWNIYSNMKLLDMPDYKFVSTFQDIENMKYGFAALDEWWTWVDSRESMSQQNKIINDIVMKARKRGLDIYYTTQAFNQIDRRIRGITSVIVIPEISYRVNGELVKLHQNVWNPVKMPVENAVLILTPHYVDAWTGNLIPQKDQIMEVELSSIIAKYDTTEEIEMIKSQIQKAIELETEFTKALKQKYQDDKVYQMPNSGQYLESLDVERLDPDGTLYLYDVVKLNRVKKTDYIALQHKSLKKIVELANERRALAYFAFKHNDVWFTLELNPELLTRVGKKTLISLNNAFKYGAIAL